jgi:hypothetical protein
MRKLKANVRCRLFRSRLPCGVVSRLRLRAPELNTAPRPAPARAIIPSLSSSRSAAPTLPPLRPFLSVLSRHSASPSTPPLSVKIAEMAIDKVDAKEREKIEAVRKLLCKQAPLSAKQVTPENPALLLRTNTHRLRLRSTVSFNFVAWLGAPMAGEQAQYCNDACLERFLRSRGDSVKKAAKHLRTVLSWRESVGAGRLAQLPFVSHSRSLALAPRSPRAFRAGPSTPRNLWWWLGREQKEASISINASLRCAALLLCSSGSRSRGLFLQL